MKQNGKEKRFEAAFISASESYLSTLEEMPEAGLPLGDWIGPVAYTRYYLRQKIVLAEPVISAELEFQSSLPIDIFLGNKQIFTEKIDGWYLSGIKNVTSLLEKRTNYLNVRGFLSDDPMRFFIGVRGCLKIVYAGGKTEFFNTGDGFKCYGMCNFGQNDETPDWQTEPLTIEREMNRSKLHPSLRVRATYLKKEFSVEKPIRKAILFATAKGLYVPYINGKRVTDGRFFPGSAESVCEYRVFDVTEFIKPEKNVVGAELGSGFYNSESWGSFFNKIPALAMQLEIEYSDGETYIVSTDETWHVTASPRVANDIQFGERYDARLEIENWCSSFDTGMWANAEKRYFKEIPFKETDYNPVRIKNELTAVKIFKLSGGAVCYDFGVNSSGRVKLLLKHTNYGERVVIRYCEALECTENGGCAANVTEYGDVYFYKDTLEDGIARYGARNIDVYVCKGAEEESYVPEFTFTGFRYIYVCGYSGEYDRNTVKKVEMYNDLEVTGVFETSHTGLTKIWDAVRRAYRSNIVTGPTDCPTREKNFWNGDLQTFVNTACWYMNNNRFLQNWTEYGRKMGGDDTYGWADENYVTPLTLYKFYGNTEVVARNYEKVKNLIETRKKQVKTGEILPSENTFTYGDHKAGKRVSDDFFCSAYYCYMFKCAAETADILGNVCDAKTYRYEFEKARKAFNEKYYLPSQHDYLPKVQGGIVYPVAFGIADKSEIRGLAETLHNYVVADNYHLMTGFMSTEFILGILCDNGYGEDALRLITAENYPSLLNMIGTANCGTTTESWEAKVGVGDSLNHYAVGNAARWFFEYLGGIKPVKPNFDEVVIKPYFFKCLHDVRVSYRSVHGLIESAWEYNDKDDTFTWNVTVPSGVKAHFDIPNCMLKSEKLREERYLKNLHRFDFIVKNTKNLF